MPLDTQIPQSRDRQDADGALTTVIHVPDEVWQRPTFLDIRSTDPTPGASEPVVIEPSVAALPGAGRSWDPAMEESFDAFLVFLGRSWNTPSHIPVDWDPEAEALEPGVSIADGEALGVDAMRAIVIAVGEGIARIRAANIEHGAVFAGNRDADFPDQFAPRGSETVPGIADFGRQAVRFLDWARTGRLLDHVEPHLREVAAMLLVDVLDFIYVGVAEIVHGRDIDETFGEDFGFDVELIAVNENMPGIVWRHPGKAEPETSL